ncbi:MAG: NAD(P)H-binding protein [Bacteroidia bacterium]|nr:NAD(P)H-binding protein [Bacteroidia bacterium]
MYHKWQHGSIKILILGSTGRTGKLILKEAHEKGFQINCLIRDLSKVRKLAGVTYFEGTPSDIAVLEESIQGCDVVISALNISRKTDFPWSPLRTPKDFLSIVMGNILELSQKYELKKVIICSAWGVGESQKNIPWWFRLTINSSNILPAYEDHERQEKLLMGSSINWVIVRPAGLINTEGGKTIKVSYNNSPKPSLTISRADLASFMVNAISDEGLSRKCPVISTPII